MLINESNPHGGQVYGRKIKADFSVNINPQGAPEEVMEAARRAIELCGQYPDACCSELREAIAAEENVKKEHIICGNGRRRADLSAFGSHKAKESPDNRTDVLRIPPERRSPDGGSRELCAQRRL